MSLQKCESELPLRGESDWAGRGMGKGTGIACSKIHLRPQVLSPLACLWESYHATHRCVADIGTALHTGAR